MQFRPWTSQPLPSNGALFDADGLREGSEFAAPGAPGHVEGDGDPGVAAPPAQFPHPGYACVASGISMSLMLSVPAFLGGGDRPAVAVGVSDRAELV